MRIGHGIYDLGLGICYLHILFGKSHTLSVFFEACHRILDFGLINLISKNTGGY